MKFIYIIATIYLGILGIGALFIEFNKFHWFWKLTLGLIAVIAVILLPKTVFQSNRETVLIR